MRHKSYVQSTIVALQPSSYVLSTETVPYAAKFLNTELVSRILDRAVDDGFYGRLRMQCAPFGEIETCFLLLDAHWVTGEKVGDED